MDLLLSPSSSSDWDLLAVVRGCSSKSTTTTTTSSSLPDLQHQRHCYHELTTSRFPQPPPLSQTTPQILPEFIEFPSLAGELHDLFNPFCSLDLNFSSPYTTSLRSSPPILTHPPPLPQPRQQSSQFVFGSTTTTGYCSSSPTACSGVNKFSISNINPITFQSRRNATTPLGTHQTKKRKNLQKKVVVVQVPAEGLSSSSSKDDLWAWRKYGQKPIKGSPYPRGYYRCSSSKGCLARKQVERNRTDPNMFIVTYTADHNHPMPTHRNSLAGTTRQPKPPTSPSSVTSSTTSSTGDHRHYSTVQDCSSPSTMTTDSRSSSLPTTVTSTNIIQSTSDCKMEEEIETEENVFSEMIPGFEDDADFLPGFLDFVDDMDVGDRIFDKFSGENQYVF